MILKKEKYLLYHFNKEQKIGWLLYWLANQWKISEISNGTAWKMLKKFEKFQ